MLAYSDTRYSVKPNMEVWYSTVVTFELFQDDLII